MGYWNRKFHLQHTLPDGNILKCFINIGADRKEDLPETVHGTYWVSKENGYWHGMFNLAEGEKYDYRENPVTEFEPWVIISTVVRPPLKNIQRPTSIEEATTIIDYLKPVKYENIDKFEDNIYDNIYAVETHYWDI